MPNAAYWYHANGASGRKPRTRDEVCNVKMQFQGLSVTLPGYGTIPWFGGFINSLTSAQRDYCRSVELATGTHCLRQLSYGYSEPDYTYPIPPGDFTQDLSTFKARLDEDLDAGLIPIVELSGDGQGYDPNGGTYGFPWLTANLERILDGLGDTATDCLFFHCWESVNYGGWLPDNLFDMTLLHRQLRPTHHLAWHFSYAWPGDGSGGTLGPVGEWQSPAGLAMDVFLMEGDAPFITEAGVPIPGDALNGWQQRASRILGPKANHAMIDPKNDYNGCYWTQDTARGPRFAIPFETDEYRWARNRVSVAEIEQERKYITQLGFSTCC